MTITFLVWFFYILSLFEIGKSYEMKPFCTCGLLKMEYIRLSTKLDFSFSFFLHEVFSVIPHLLLHLSLLVMKLIQQIKSWSFSHSILSTEALYSFMPGCEMCEVKHSLMAHCPFLYFILAIQSCFCTHIIMQSYYGIWFKKVPQWQMCHSGLSYPAGKWIKISRAKTQTLVMTICCLRRYRWEHVFVVPVTAQMDLYMGHMACLATPSLYLLPWK